MVSIEVWCRGPQQKPFAFGVAKRLEDVLVPQDEAQRWEAGQDVTIADVQYTVAKTILPKPNKVSLWVKENI